MPMRSATLLLAAVCAVLAAPAVSGGCDRMDVEIVAVTRPPPAHVAACRAAPAGCDLSGMPLIAMSAEMRRLLGGSGPHPDRHRAPHGPCGAFLALRMDLAARGVPGAALTCASGRDGADGSETPVLLIETTAGTFARVAGRPGLTCWRDLPLTLHMRERRDGLWQRLAGPAS